MNKHIDFLLPGFVALSLSIPSASQAQQGPPPGMTQGSIIDYAGCKYPSFVIDGGTVPAGLASGTPDKFFHDQLTDKSVRKLRGILLVQVQIDTLGHGCCPRIQNMTKANDDEIRALQLDQVVQRGIWNYTRPQSKYREPVAASITLRLVFDGRNGFMANYLRIGKFIPATPKP
jgi:hypothetical protein